MRIVLCYLVCRKHEFYPVPRWRLLQTQQNKRPLLLATRILVSHSTVSHRPSLLDPSLPLTRQFTNPSLSNNLERLAKLSSRPFTVLLSTLSLKGLIPDFRTTPRNRELRLNAAIAYQVPGSSLRPMPQTQRRACR
jgi:hypothetical protein